MKRLITLLTDRQIDYCVLHGWESAFEESPSDIDLAVSRRDLRSLELALENNNGWMPIQLFQHETSCYYFVLAKRALNGVGYSAVDVAVDYRRDGRVFFSPKDLLSGRRQVNGFRIAAPTTEFTYLLVKRILKGFPLDRRLTRLQTLSALLGQEASVIARRLLGDAMGDQTILGLKQAAPARLNALLPDLRVTLRRELLKRDPLNPIRYWIPELRRRWRRWSHPTGLVIAVLGADGAGKSTLIEHLRRRLRPAFRETTVFHQRPTLLARGGRSLPVTEPHAKSPYPLWLSVLKVPYYVWLYAFGYLSVVRPRLIRSTLVLFDRYYDDLCADPRRYRYGGPTTLPHLARFLIPTPDLYFVLDVSGDECLHRKREVSKQEAQRQHAVYRRLGCDLPAGVILDGSLPANDVARAAADIVVDCLRQRYLRRRALWFRSHEAKSLEWLTAAFRRSPASTPSDTPVADPARSTTFGWITAEDERGYGIPLKSTRIALKSLDLYNPQSPRAHLTKTALALGFKLGIGRRWLRPAELPVDGLTDYLRGVLGCKAVDIAVCVGPPSLDRKAVLLVLTGEGEAIAYAKLGSNETTNALVRQEAETLAHLSTGGFDAFDLPAVLHSGPWNGYWVCVQSAPKDKTVRAVPALLTEYLIIARELAAFHTRWLPLKASGFWKLLLEYTSQIGHAHYRGVMERGMRKADAWLKDTALPFHFCHGDFAPWNMKRGPQRPFVFDWEYAHTTGVPAHDLFHFVHETMWGLEKRHPRAVHSAFRDHKQARVAIQAHLTGLGASMIPQNLLLFLYYLYILGRLARGAEKAMGRTRVHPKLYALANAIETADGWL